MEMPKASPPSRWTQEWRDASRCVEGRIAFGETGSGIDQSMRYIHRGSWKRPRTIALLGASKAS